MAERRAPSVGYISTRNARDFEKQGMKSEGLKKWLEQGKKHCSIKKGTRKRLGTEKVPTGTGHLVREINFAEKKKL